MVVRALRKPRGTAGSASVGLAARTDQATATFWQRTVTESGAIVVNVMKRQIAGYLISALGTGVWLYGYFVPGNPSLIDWHAHAPEWIAKFLPNCESEIGMGLMFAAMIPMYWPSKR
jgi:hypothetical protein